MARNKRQQGPDSGALVLDSVDELRDIVFCLKTEGKTVVMTNGAFDLLHVGHLRCIRDAKSRGDYLVVAVNSDNSIKKYKHAKLPIVPQAERLEMISSLRWVDYVILFEQETCDELIATVQPDIVAKGSDYDEKSVPERDTILAYGGQIAICGDPKDHASSKLIQRIRRLKL